MNKTRTSLLLALCLASAATWAQPTDPLPEWDQLSAQQREVLVAPIRDRWNSTPPEQRARMLEHAQRWQKMTPEQRRQARHGMHRFEQMSPERRAEARALFFKMRQMNKAERQQLAEQWKRMSAEERKAWMEKNTPSHGEHPPRN